MGLGCERFENICISKMKNEIDIVRDVSKKLDSASIQYMLTGSVAMNYYSLPRMTRDIDIVIQIGKEDISTIVNLFKADYYVEPDSIDIAIQSERLFNIIHDESFIKVDFIIRQSGIYRLEEFERRKKIEFGDFQTFIVSKEDLILSKLLWSKKSKSEMQKRDIQNLVKSEVDLNYLEQKLNELNLKDWYEEIMNE